jgi:glycosyltransferase involved in cell wall biosynthesis
MLRGTVTRIAVDSLAVSPAGKGLARVQQGVLEALAAEPGLRAFVRTPEAAALLPVETEVVRARPGILWELAGRPLRTRGFDVVVTWTERLSSLPQPPTVVWLYESPVHRAALNRRLGASRYQLAADRLTLALWKPSLRRAAHVVFGSQATAAEVLAELPELRDRSSVVHAALAQGFAPGPTQDRGVYAFHLGSRDPRDNTETALEAARLAGVKLLVAGGARFDPRGADVEFLGRVSDEKLVGLYRGAAVYLDPTLFEGFGYGALEAMACGTPVVASNTTSIPEIVGDAGLLCDPTSAEELAAALRRVLDEPGLADNLRARGLARAAEFTWERTAEGLLAAVRAAVEA